MKNRYITTATSIYLNYFLLGMVNIILASNMAHLTEQWNTDAAGISFIISAIGIGKLLTYTLSGYISDKVGRKPLMIFAALAMGIFLIGIPLSPSYKIAFVLALLAGMGNSAMDASSYPGLTEIFPKSAGSANVLVKAFMSAGATLLPFIILWIADRDLFYGYAFFIPAAIYIVNFLLMFMCSFPNHRLKKNENTQGAVMTKFKSEPIFWKEGIALVVIGFTSTGLFTVSQIWLPSYGEDAIGMAADSAIKLLSYYSVGSLISVLILTILLKKFLRPVTVMVLYPILSFISILVILIVKVPVVTSVTAFFIGFSTAGVFQLAITVMTELFWQRKGTVTGIVATASSLAAIVMPFVTGLMAKSGNISIIFIFDAVLSAVGCISALFVLYRYGRVIQGDTAREEKLEHAAE
jgi:MFS family permease